MLWAAYVAVGACAGLAAAAGTPAFRLAAQSAAALLVLGTCVFAWHVRATWDHYIRFTRVDRSDPRAPSHKQRPATRRRSVGAADPAAARGDAERPLPSASKAAGSAARTRLRPAKDGGSVPGLSTELAQDLDMDHLHIPWVGFLWAYLAVWPSSAALAFTGMAVLLLRQRLHRLGCPVRRPCDPRLVAGRLLLESMEVLQFDRIGEDEATSAIVAHFRWNRFAMLQNDGSVRVADAFVAAVDLQTKCLTSAALDGRELHPSDAMVLIAFHSSTAGHVKLHALANWGINPMLIEDAVLQRCAVTTLIYNFFGKTRFPEYAEAWYRYGISTHDFSRIDLVFDHGLKTGICAHAETRQLMRHSDLCNFVVKVRRQFMRAFEKHEHSMLGIDMEALFVGTVLHSLDHQHFEWNIEDPLWLVPVCPDFAALAEFGRFVHAGFLKDIWTVPFPRKYRETTHPFFAEVYRRAARINKRLADQMDICIIK